MDVARRASHPGSCGQHQRAHSGQVSGIQALHARHAQAAAAQAAACPGSSSQRRALPPAAFAATGTAAAAAAAIVQPFDAPFDQPLQPSQPPLLHSIRRSGSYAQLLALLQQQPRAFSAADAIAVLHRASTIAKHDTRSTRFAAAAAASSGSSSSSGRSASDDALVVQQLVSLSLSLLLDLHHQLSAKDVANCLLSMAVLCGKGGPAAGALSSAPPAAPAVANSAQQQQRLHQHQQQQQPQQGSASSRTAAGLQQLITPASSRALGQLLQAAAPHHQLQQLLEVCHRSCLAAAQPYQLVNILYGLAVLALRPAPHVLQQLLAATHHWLPSTTFTSSTCHAAAGSIWTPKMLSQLLWAAATLQLQLSPAWLASYWVASGQLLQQFRGQDVANTCWAMARLSSSSSSSSDRPPVAWLAGLLEQAGAVSRSFTSQGLANTLWGLAVLAAPVSPARLQQLVQLAVESADRLDAQNLANIVWAAARCLQQQQQLVATSSSTGLPEAAAVQRCRQQLQTLLLACSHLLPRLQPRDWSNVLWACGSLGLAPAPQVLQQLWRRTPAGFSTSLNPHAGSGAALGRGWSQQALVTCLWGCARLRVLPPRVWMQSCEVALLSLLPAMSARDLAQTLWALGQLGCQPGEPWLQQYWIAAGSLCRQLEAATAAAADSGEQLQQAWPRDAEAAAAGALQQAVQHVVMVLQASAELGHLPPAAWLQQAVPGLTAAAPMLLASSGCGSSAAVDGQQRRSKSLQVLTCAVLAMTKLAHHASRSSDGISNTSTSSSSLDAASQGLLQHLLAAPPGADAAVPEQLSALDTLVLLTAAAHQAAAAANPYSSQQAGLLLARCQQLLEQQQQQHGSSDQLVQLAVLVASIASSSASSSSAGLRELWTAVAAAQQPQAGQQWQQEQQLPQGVAQCAEQFVSALACRLQACCSEMSAVQLSRSLAAVDYLCSSTGRLSRPLQQHGSRRDRSPGLAAVAGFVGAAGAAAGQQMAQLSGSGRATAAASLSRLGFCPEAGWLEQLLLHSSCDLAGCSSRDVCSLLQSVAVMLGRHQQQQQQQQQQVCSTVAEATAATIGQGGAPSLSAAGLAESLAGWLRCWLADSEPKLQHFTPRQLVCTAAALRQLQAVLAAAGDASSSGGGRPWRVLQLPVSWCAAFFAAASSGLHDLSGTDLVGMAVAAHRLLLAPVPALLPWQHRFCAAVAQEAAARAAIASSSSSTIPEQPQKLLLPHHVGLLAWSFRRCGFIPPASQQHLLLELVRLSCLHTRGTKAGGAGMRAQQLQVLLSSLQGSGWRMSSEWVRDVRSSDAGTRLRRRLPPGAWEALFAGLGR